MQNIKLITLDILIKEDAMGYFNESSLSTV